MSRRAKPDKSAVRPLPAGSAVILIASLLLALWAMIFAMPFFGILLAIGAMLVLLPARKQEEVSMLRVLATLLLLVAAALGANEIFSIVEVGAYVIAAVSSFPGS